MTLRLAVVLERLRKLREVLANLKMVQQIPRQEFITSFRHYWLAERGLHLAAEAVFDVGNHILAGHFNVHPSDYEDVLTRLADQGVISAGLRESFQGLGGFRNILVHGYMDLDVGRVFDSLQVELGAFSAFAEEIESFLDNL